MNTPALGTASEAVMSGFKFSFHYGMQIVVAFLSAQSQRVNISVRSTVESRSELSNVAVLLCAL